jgi:DNA end-binding protein Ku
MLHVLEIAMARPIWTGAITFGLVHVPVRLYPATQSKSVSFHQLEKGTGERIRYQRVAEESGHEVPWENIEKGFEFEKGRYVVLSPEELEALEPKKKRAIAIEEFVRISEIDPILWQATYYLGPDRKEAADAYALLRRAMDETGRVGIGRFVMRTKEYLATIRPYGKDQLALETMFFPDEIRSEDVVENLPKKHKVDVKELEMAVRLVEAMASEWNPEKHHDRFRERVLQVVNQKVRGEEIVVEKEPSAPRVVDLMKALRKSLEATEAAPARRSNGKAAARPSDGNDLQSLSKAELYERAAESDVSGRSKMSRDELIRALERKAS